MDTYNPLIAMTGCAPAYGGCVCNCHTNPHVTHMAACCHPVVDRVFSKDDPVVHVNTRMEGIVKQIGEYADTKVTCYWVKWSNGGHTWEISEVLETSVDLEVGLLYIRG